MANKLKIKRLGNNDRFNEIDLEKSEVFLDNLQDLVIDLGFAKAKKIHNTYEFAGKFYDIDTFYTLFYEDQKDDFKIKKYGIDDFSDGSLSRYSNKDLELLVIFLEKKIKLIFYCDAKFRSKVFDALKKFCDI